MARLRVGRKFLLADVPALLLLLALGTFVGQQLNQRAQQIGSKRAAVALMAELVTWNKVLIESRRVAITGQPGQSGDATAVLDAFKRQAEVVGRQLAEIEAHVASARPWFDMRQETAGLKTGWIELQSKVLALPADAEFAQ